MKRLIRWFLFLFHLEFKYKKHSNRLYSGQCDISSILFKKKKLYGPFLWTWLNCLKSTEPLQGDSLLFITEFQEILCTHLINLGKMKGWGRPWSYTVAFNTGPLDLESSALTNRPVFVFSLLIFNESKICHIRNTNIFNYQEHY